MIHGRPRPFAIVPPQLAAAPFTVITAAFAAGIAVSVEYAPHPWLLIAAIVIGSSGLAHAIVTRSRTAGVAWALLTLLGLGAARASAAAPVQSPDSAARFIDRDVLLEGVVVAEPLDRSGVAVLRVRPTRLAADGAITTPDDVVLLRVAETGGAWKYGDVLQVEGRLERPPRIEDFDYGMYLARQGVFAWMPRAKSAQAVGYAPPSEFMARMLRAKDALRRSVRDVVPAPESALLNGILIGDDDALPAPLVEAFRRTGTSHIISISGFNVGVIVGMVLAVVRRLTHPRNAAPALLVMLWLYAAFVGGSASVVRAVAMTSVALVGQWMWRRGFTLNTLCAAAFVMLAAQPFYLVDIGFQLSFCATLGLVTLADVLTNLVPPALMRARFVGAVLEGVLLTTAAQITTLPLLLIHYEQLSLITLLTNALVLPMQPPIMGLGMLGGGIGILSRDLGMLAALPVFGLLRASIRLVELTAAAPWAVAPLGRFGVGWVFAYYGALSGLLLLRTAGPDARKHLGTRLRSQLRRIVLSGAAFAALATAAAIAWAQPPPRAQIWMQGSSALLLAPSGAQMMLLGDGDPVGLATQRLPWWDNSIDVVVLPRLDARLQKQAEIFLRTYSADVLVIPMPAVTTATLYQMWTQSPLNGVGAVRVAAAGDRWWESAEWHATAVLLGADELGNAVLGARVRGRDARIDLFTAGELTPAALQDDAAPAATMLFAAPTTANQGFARALPLDWLLWSRTPSRAHPDHASVSRVLALDRWPHIGFQLDSTRIQLLP
jgi:competence protein ComEC